jgi:3-oxoacyl-[acyl-carrier-protein] synthase II
MAGRRVVVTGLGLVAPVGLDVKSSWESILAGRSGIKPITHFDIEPFSTRFGGPILAIAASRRSIRSCSRSASSRSRA